MWGFQNRENSFCALCSIRGSDTNCTRRYVKKKTIILEWLPSYYLHKLEKETTNFSWVYALAVLPTNVHNKCMIIFFTGERTWTTNAA